MATDFFERQDAARRSTKWLVGMFLLGAVGIVGATTLVGVAASEAARDRTQASDSVTALGVTEESIALGIMAGIASLVLIVGGSTYKVAALSGGGNVVAEGLGGRRVFPDTTDPVERRLLNVVEEMALSSGVPV